MVVVIIIIMVMVVMHKWSACTANSWHQVRLPKANAIVLVEKLPGATHGCVQLSNANNTTHMIVMMVVLMMMVVLRT